MTDTEKAKIRIKNECKKRRNIRNAMAVASLLLIGGTVKVAINNSIVHAFPCGMLAFAAGLMAKEIHKSINHISKNKDIYIANILQNKQNKYHIGKD